jgi:hypothetical protein
MIAALNCAAKMNPMLR